MRYIISILTFLLFLCGFLMVFGTIRFGIGIYTPALTILTFIGFVILLVNRRAGQLTVFLVCLGWLLRYFEHASFLVFYDIQNIDRWIVVSVPILLSISIIILSFKSRQHILGKTFNLKLVALLALIISAIGFLSFARKTQINEFNCWYYIDKDKDNFRISFALAPDHVLETTSNSEELKQFVLKYGIRDAYRVGIYCPETKVKIITSFKRIKAMKILGFRNSTTDYKATLDNPIEIDINKLEGDKGILEPYFTLGD